MRALFCVLLFGLHRHILIQIVRIHCAELTDRLVDMQSRLDHVVALPNVAQIVQLFVEVLRLERGATERLAISAGAVRQARLDRLRSVTVTHHV